MSPSPDEIDAARLGRSQQPEEYSPEERVLLLKLAHDAIAAAISRSELDLNAPTPHLAEPRGVFTSLYVHGELRGCVGYVLPVGSLYQAVAETARGAAFDDSRFSPLTRHEMPNLEVSLSVLSPLKPARPEEIEIGRHGLVVKLGNRRGLLLPQVPGEHGWDRIAFLEHTCRKAGLPDDAWQKGATLEVFSAEVFGDEKSGDKHQKEYGTAEVKSAGRPA